MVPIILALATSTATLFGGSLPLYTRLQRIQQRYLVAFAGGAMVAIALFDLIPEMEVHNAAALLLGFFPIYLLEQAVVIHTCAEVDCDVHALGWPALIGIAAESLLDGVAIAVGFQAEPGLALLIALAVFAHEVPRGLTTTLVMRRAGYGRFHTWLALFVDAGFAPLGVLFAELVPAAAFEPLLGFTAGVFLYIGASDLIPEAHRQLNPGVVAATLAGGGLIPALAILLGG